MASASSDCSLKPQFTVYLGNVHHLQQNSALKKKTIATARLYRNVYTCVGKLQNMKVRLRKNSYSKIHVLYLIIICVWFGDSYQVLAYNSELSFCFAGPKAVDEPGRYES